MPKLDDLPYDEYQKEMARMEAEAAEAAKNADLGLDTLEENDEHTDFGDFLSGETAPPDQADDPSAGAPEAVTEESNPGAFAAGEELEQQMAERQAGKGAGKGHSLGGVLRNMASGIKGLFSSGAMGAIKMVGNIGAKLGMPKAATYGLIFILGGGTFAGIAALFGQSNDLYKYADGVGGCDVVVVRYHENQVYKAPTQSTLDARAGALFNALNSDMTFEYGIRNGGTTVLESIQDDTVDDGAGYYYVQPAEDRYDWNEDGKIDDRDDRSRYISGGYHHVEEHTVEAFQDEQILGMIMAASAESKIDPAAYEMNYRVGPASDDAPVDSDYYINVVGSAKDMILSRSHHVQWNTYCERMFALYAQAGISINEDAYKYTDQFGNTMNDMGQQNYYPGVGLWQWTGQRGYNLHWFANQLEFDTDADGDGANDAMYSLNVQVVYLLEIEKKKVKIPEIGLDEELTDWGKEEVSTYQVEYYVNVPYKPSTNLWFQVGTAPGMEANWVPLADYQDPSARDMQVPWDAYHQLRPLANYKYESTTGARLSDKNCDEERDAFYFADADRYDGVITPYDDAPFPVKDYLYNDDGSIKKAAKHKYLAGTVFVPDPEPDPEEDSGEESDDEDEDEDDDDEDEEDEEPRGHYDPIQGYDRNDDGVLKPEDDYIIVEVKLDERSTERVYYLEYYEGSGEDRHLVRHRGLDVEGEKIKSVVSDFSAIDVWDMDDDGKVDAYDENNVYDPAHYNPDAYDPDDENPADWYIDHVGYADTAYKEGIFYPTKEVYYQNLSCMVLACAPGDVAPVLYIYQNDNHAIRQYQDMTPVADYWGEDTKIIYQSPGITAVDFWEDYPWGDGTEEVIPAPVGSTSGPVTFKAYKAIQKGDGWWDELEEAREARMAGETSAGARDADRFYGNEADEIRSTFREAADMWRDEIWVWANAHARAAVARNKGLEFCLGWLGCPNIESHTWFVRQPMVREVTSFAGRKDTGRYGVPADCLVHYAECMLKTDWHGSEEHGESITDMMYEDMNTRHMNDVWHASERVCGGEFDNSSIAAAAVSWAWLKGRNSDADVNLAVLDPGGCPKAYLCTSLYCAVHDIVLPGDPYYSSCDRGAATAVLASGSDDSFPAGNPLTQFDYMRSHPETWEWVGPLASAWDTMQPGDIIVSSTPDPRHIIVFVGPDAVYEKWGKGVGSADKAIVHSSHSSNLSSSRGPRCDLDGSFLVSDPSHNYQVFRCKNEDLDSSAKKAEVDAQESFLGGLNNGDGKGGGYYAPQY